MEGLRKSAMLFRLFGSPPYFYFRFRLYTATESAVFCLILPLQYFGGGDLSLPSHVTFGNLGHFVSPQRFVGRQ